MERERKKEKIGRVTGALFQKRIKLPTIEISYAQRKKALSHSAFNIF